MTHHILHRRRETLEPLNTPTLIPTYPTPSSNILYSIPPLISTWSDPITVENCLESIRTSIQACSFEFTLLCISLYSTINIIFLNYFLIVSLHQIINATNYPFAKTFRRHNKECRDSSRYIFFVSTMNNNNVFLFPTRFIFAQNLEQCCNQLHKIIPKAKTM